jgi:hypothetical protein
MSNELRSHRTSLGGVVVGVVISAAVCVIATTLVLALRGPIGLATDQPWLEGGIALGVIALSTFFGGRFAASDGRALVSRDGALHGAVTWAALTVLVAAGGLASLFLGWASAVSEPAEVKTLAWAFLTAEGVALLAAVLGGVRGAKAEARAIGLVDIRPGDEYEDQSDPAVYERRFYADQT